MVAGAGILAEGPGRIVERACSHHGGRDLASWHAERRELWGERALIMEVEGHLPRDEAERLAFALVSGEMISSAC